VASLPHGVPQNAARPGQQVCSPVGVKQRQSCSQMPFTQRSAVHELPSLQSASAEHSAVGVGGSMGTHWQFPAESAVH
jgi:hypothetical protein